MSHKDDTRSDPSTIDMREVTREEIDFLLEHGWVKVPNLVSRETARLLLERAVGEFGEDGRAGFDENVKRQGYQTWFRSRQDPMDDPAFSALGHSSVLGRNAARLLGRDSSIRLMVSSFTAKLTGGHQQGQPTDFHQDISGHTYLEGNFLTVWIALDEITPDMGPMQFYDGSHKLGNLGQIVQKDIWNGWAPLLDKTCSLTDPVDYRPGDATFHMASTIHGTGLNLGKRPRWSWAGVLVPGDARFTGAANFLTDGLGLEPEGMVDHAKFPIIYSPSA